MSPYFLRSARLGFRNWSACDFELAWGLWGDPAVARWVGGPFTAEQVRERLDREIANQEATGAQYWPAFLLASGEHVGCCGLRPHRPEARTFAFGFYLRPAYWGCGLAGEAARAVLEHTFSTLGAAALVAGHNPGNDPSRRLLGKLGFRYSHHELYPPTGLQHPSYVLTAEEYATEPAVNP
jgi:[ribosomal protein S5]-alanine N-acetyltransferase